MSNQPQVSMIAQAEQINAQLQEAFAQHYKDSQSLKATEERIRNLQNLIAGVNFGRELEKEVAAKAIEQADSEESTSKNRVKRAPSPAGTE